MITCLNDGGAEAVLFRLISNLSHVDHTVVSLSGRGKYAELLEQINVEVIDLDMKKFRGFLLGPFRLFRLLRNYKPSCVQTWMYHADFIGGIISRIACCRNLYWGIHNSDVSFKNNTFVRYILIRINAVLSWFIPSGIISCSSIALLAHSSAGYCRRKILFIPNGHLVNIFFPDNFVKKSIRAELNIEDDTFVIGMVARLHPQKDHPNLLNALSIVREKYSKFVCLLVGTGLDDRSSLVSYIQEKGLESNIRLVGSRTDIPFIMNSLDLYCSSSFSEAFPNVLCEAMATGVPCVTTDVGDSAYIVGDTGWVVSPRSPKLLSEAILVAISALPCDERSRRARERIVENFSINSMVDRYESAWSSLKSY